MNRIPKAFTLFGMGGKDKTKAGFGKSIGVDLGTTNTVFGIKKVHGEILQNSEGEELTPSCVTKRGHDFVVGRNALAWLKQDPENTILSIKRLMGRNFADDQVKKIVGGKKVSYKIRPLSGGTEHSLAVVLNGKEYTPEQISAFILKKIKKDAELALGEEVTHAVITIPSYFNDKQKHATRVAAAAAGFRVQRLLPEPTAAAISFGVDPTRDQNINTIMVYDFGGGTFDISVLTMSAGQYIELAKGGDMWLGGDDIDVLVTERVYTLLQKEHPDLDVKALIEKLPAAQRSRFRGELREKIEKVKIRLSSDAKASLDILGLLKDVEGNILDVDVEISRAEFEDLISPLVDRSLGLMDELLKGLHFTPEMIDKVLLVGGCSCIPLVQRKVREKYGVDKVLIHQKPMLSIAEGAAVLSHRLSECYECPGCEKEVTQKDSVCPGCGFDLEKATVETGVFDIVHSVAHDYYISLENHAPYLLVAKNTPLPTEKTEVFRLLDSSQKLVHLKFFNIVNEQEESIGDLWLGIGQQELSDNNKPETIEPGSTAEVVCRFRIDENNLIEVEATMKDWPDIKISKTLSRGKDDERLFIRLEADIQQVNDSQPSSYAVTDFAHRASDLVHDINRIVDQETGEVRGDILKKAEGNLGKAKKIFEADIAPRGAISYAKSMLDYPQLLDPREIKKLEKAVRKAEECDRDGSYEEICDALDDMYREVDKHKLAKIFQEADRGYYYYKERNDPQAERFLSFIHNIQEYARKGETAKLTALITEIRPELAKVADLERSDKVRVEKGITR